VFWAEITLFDQVKNFLAVDLLVEEDVQADHIPLLLEEIFALALSLLLQKILIFEDVSV
jgi:hypothetical protein